MRRHLLLAIAIVALSLVACGEGSNDGAQNDVNTAPAAEGSPTEDAPPSDGQRYNTTAKEKYDEAKIVCGLGQPEDIAKDFGMTTSDPDRIATRYARGYVPEFRQSAYEGCLEGLR